MGDYMVKLGGSKNHDFCQNFPIFLGPPSNFEFFALIKRLYLVFENQHF